MGQPIFTKLEGRRAEEAPRYGPFGRVGPNDKPLCEECDVEMQMFGTSEAEGWGCDDCGWSFDAPLTASTVYPEYRRSKDKRPSGGSATSE